VVVRKQGRRLRCGEYCGDAEQALRVVRRLARQRHCDEVEFHTLPDTSELIRRLRRGDCRVETRYQQSGGPMVRMLNLPATLAKLSGELSRRLGASHLAGWRGGLLIADANEKVVLKIAAGRVTVAPVGETRHAISGDTVVQLILGTDHPAEVAVAGGIQLSGDAAQLVEVLFPAQWPELSYCDRC
jgi:hypothetical protein